MPSVKAAAVTGLGIGAILMIQVGDLLDSASSGNPIWSETERHGAPARAVLCIIAGVSILALARLYRLLFCPLEIFRSPDDVGYVVEDGRTRAQAANEVRRRRKIGELPPVYPNGWYRVLDSHMLQRGEVKNVTVLGEQVAVFRGQDGAAYVLDAYCPHLGANLAVGGRVLESCIECPFHGWQFQGTDGKCVRIPYAEKVPEFAKVRSWPSCEINRQILVWFHCDGEEPQWTVPEQQEITKGEWAYRGRTEHFINAHIQEIPENAGDIAHLAHLHNPGIVSGVDLRHTNAKMWKFLRHDWKVGPGLVFLLFDHSFLGRGVIMHCVTPVEPLLQCVSHTIFYQSNILPLVPKFILKAECIQFERDVMIWNNKKYVSKPLLVKEDSAIQKHRRWFSQFYSGNSPRLQSRRDTLDF
ncbi:cholesterol 7-desaturase nvd isoform X2 [Mugil cephalus]|uniref:cholesterol 7-desaturase nvd isoform X2 n=1 Tax=Mugil cephalus TaxID=48193 RepID=UPI001FB80649|nr:cholesterol 7-desaturase nvd isoform X2 [Mugil cephalus]